MKFKAVSTRPHLPVALLSLMQIMHVVPNHERVTRLQTCLCSREQHVLCTSGQMKMRLWRTEEERVDVCHCHSFSRLVKAILTQGIKMPPLKCQFLQGGEDKHSDVGWIKVFARDPLSKHRKQAAGLLPCTLLLGSLQACCGKASDVTLHS